MILILLCILVVVFIFFITVTLLKMREAWVYETKKKPLHQQFRNIQKSYKDIVLPLYTNDLINSTEKQKLSSLVSNFFVFQPLNDANIDYLVFTVESCKTAFEQCIIANTQYPDQLPAILERLINFIPSGARDFDSEFYHSSFPRALETLAASIQKLSKKPVVETRKSIDEEEFEIFKERSRREKQRQLLEEKAPTESKNVTEQQH